MISFNMHWGGLDYLQDSTPADGCSIVFLPSIVNDAPAAVPQMEAEEGVRQFMQSQFRMAAENLHFGSGVIISQGV